MEDPKVKQIFDASCTTDDNYTVLTKIRKTLSETEDSTNMENYGKRSQQYAYRTNKSKTQPSVSANVQKTIPVLASQENCTPAPANSTPVPFNESAGTAVPANLKNSIRAVLLSQAGVPLSRFLSDYHALMTERLNFRRYGFTCVEHLLRSMPDVARFDYDPMDNIVSVFGICDRTIYMPLSARIAEGLDGVTSHRHNRSRSSNHRSSHNKGSRRTRGGVKRSSNNKKDSRNVKGDFMTLMENGRGLYSLCYKVDSGYPAIEVEIEQMFAPVPIAEIHIVGGLIFVRFRKREEAITVLKKFSDKIDINPAHEREKRQHNSKHTSVSAHKPLSIDTTALDANRFDFVTIAMINVPYVMTEADVRKMFSAFDIAYYEMVMSGPKMCIYVGFHSVEDALKAVKLSNSQNINNRIIVTRITRESQLKYGLVDDDVNGVNNKGDDGKDAEQLKNGIDHKDDYDSDNDIASEQVTHCGNSTGAAAAADDVHDKSNGEDEMPELEDIMPDLELASTDDEDGTSSLSSHSSFSTNFMPTAAIFIANFPHHTQQSELEVLMTRFKFVDVSVKNTDTENRSTYAIITLPNTYMAEVAVGQLDQSVFQGKSLMVGLISGDSPVPSTSTPHPDSSAVPGSHLALKLPATFTLCGQLLKKHWPHVSMEHQELTPGNIDVMVTDVIDNQHFWGNIITQVDRLDRVMKMTSVYQNSAQSHGLDNLCAAMFQEELFRAYTMQVVNESSYEVFYMDFGNTAVVPVTDTKAVPDIMWNEPPLATPFKLTVSHPDLKTVCENKVISIRVLSVGCPQLPTLAISRLMS